MFLGHGFRFSSFTALSLLTALSFRSGLAHAQEPAAPPPAAPPPAAPPPAAPPPDAPEPPGPSDSPPAAPPAPPPAPSEVPVQPAQAAPTAAADAAAPGPEVPAAEATEATEPKADAEPHDLSGVVVTGVRGNRPRTVANSPSPIDVIGREELHATGHVGLKETLGALVPSLNMPALGGGGTSASVRPYSYRGLSGDYLLVLVNGKRRHTTALINNLSRVSGGSTPIDLDLIPAAAVGHIEVLRDGAAAQYGSDAIAGVMNIILDKEPEGLSFSQSIGQTYEHGAPLVQQMLSYGIPLGKQGGFVRLSAEAKYHDSATSSADPYPDPFQGKPNPYYPTLNGVEDPREAAKKGTVYAGGYGRSNRDIVISGAYNAELPVTPNLTLYSFSTLAYRDVKDARGAYAANNIASLPEIYPNGFQAYRRIWEWDGQAAIGGRGKLANWDWDLSTGFGRDNAKLGAVNTLNPSLGPTSPTSFVMGRQIQDLWINNLDVSRPFNIGLPEPLTVSGGLEHRYERFKNVAGDADSYRDGGYIIPTGTDPFHATFGGRTPSPGLVSFTGTSPADARGLDRNNVAAYVDLSTSPAKKWFTGVAARAEHYDDSAGNTVSGKLSTRWEFLPGLAVRGGVNSGFRAPSLAQTGFSTTQNTATIIEGERVRTTSKFLAVDSPAAIALGAEPLKPEKSFNVSSGLTYQLARALHVTVDGYYLNIKDRIVKTDFLGTPNNGGAAVSGILNEAGITGVDSAQFFINGVDTRTLGFDIVADYTLRHEKLGTFKPSVAYSYANTKITHLAENPPELASLNVVLFGRQGQIDLVRAAPRAKFILTGNWNIWRLHTIVRLTRYGKYVEASTTPGFDTTYGAKAITDIDVGYDLTENVTVALGAYNLFNVYPDKKGPIALDGSGVYGSFAPFGLSGGYYYARLSVNL
jgi:iron complex outermembrane recepter protein